MARVQEDKNTVTIRDGSAARTREGMGRGEIQKYRFGRGDSKLSFWQVSPTRARGKGWARPQNWGLIPRGSLVMLCPQEGTAFLSLAA